MTPTDAGRIPTGLHPPVAMVVAQVVETIPQPGALPGGCVYEPKLDGYRLVAIRDGGSTSLWSRQGKDLTRGFLDIAAAAAEQVPAGTVLDGEVVIWRADRLDFTALQRRLAGSDATLARVARETPASYAAFDVLAARLDDGPSSDLRGWGFHAGVTCCSSSAPTGLPR